MNKLTIALDHCYGIKNLRFTLDFTGSRAFAIYAPNGTMKSSLAQTFIDYSTGAVSSDRFYSKRITKRAFTDEGGAQFDPASVFAIRPYDESFQTEKVSTLLVNDKLRREYERLFIKIDTARTSLLDALKATSKTKVDIEAELIQVFAEGDWTLLETLRRVRDRLATRQRDLAPYKDIEYDKLFDERVIGVIDTDPIRTDIEEYIKRYNQLLAQSKYFKRDVFNYYDGGEVAKNLGSHGFFKFGHRVVLHGDKEEDVTSQKGLETLIAEEKSKIHDDPKIRKAFEQIDKALKKNVNLRAFEAYLCEHEEILPLLVNIPQAKAEVWLSYFNVHFELLHSLVEKYVDAEKRRREIEQQAEAERTQWEGVVSIFNARFFVPFQLSIANRMDAVLRSGAPVLQFTFDDGTEKAAVNRDALLQGLSQGERKALYILNIVFEVQARKQSGTETLFVVDDIADSFDYKNKYAIVQYLRDIQDEPFFRLLVLTHNFDFFRTLNSRFVPYDHCLMAVKTGAGIDLQKAAGIKNVFVNDWKKNFDKDLKKRVACIPFLRNLIEYTRGDTDADYTRLTSLLHWKSDTATILESDLQTIFNMLFGGSGRWASAASKVVDDIFTVAQGCLSDAEGVNFENKIVLSIAIRLQAERYMVKKIADPAFVAAIKGNQTDDLIKQFTAKNLGDASGYEVLQRVQLMTPENIHLNSFMYEPILDMSDQHLRSLYQDVRALT